MKMIPMLICPRCNMQGRPVTQAKATEIRCPTCNRTLGLNFDYTKDDD